MFAAPPPPIATSVLLPPSQHSPAGRSSSRGSRENGARPPQNPRRSVREGVDPLIVLQRRERSIQKELQSLLDAQSAGLIQGFGGSPEEGSERGSNTPTTSRSVSGVRRRESGSNGRSGSAGIVPVRQPKTRPVGLRGARRGLLREMLELVELKQEENQVLDREIERRDILLRRINTWENRIATTKAKLSSPTPNPAEEDLHIHNLEEEQRAIDAEIQELQDRLNVLRNRKANLAVRLRESVNKREARLSSYRGALRDAEAEVTSFLHHPPLPPSSVMGDDDEGFYSLPPLRRTLSMARDWWEREQAALFKKKIEVERENSALKEGATEWEECVKEIITFEDELRKKMKSGQEVTEADLRKQVESMGGVLEKLGKVRGRAEKEGWNLLLCAVGAEEEAFKQGRGILMGALGISEDDKKAVPQANDPLLHDTLTNGQEDKGTDNDDEDPPADLLNGLDEVHLSKSEDVAQHQEASEDEDDGPNLDELLVDNSVLRG